MRVPCYGCTERHPGCHARCERYAEFSKECRRINDERRKINLSDSEDIIIKGVMRQKKGKDKSRPPEATGKAAMSMSTDHSINEKKEYVNNE